MKHTLLLALTSFCFIACEKESTSNQTNKTEMIASAEWKYDNGGLGDASGNIVIDFSTTNFIPACTFDNSIRFNANGTGIVSENANVCTGAPATTNFNWSFSSNETVLNLSGGAVAGIGGSFKIKELSSTKLTLLKDTTAPVIGAVTAIVNLKH